MTTSILTWTGLTAVPPLTLPRLVNTINYLHRVVIIDLHTITSHTLVEHQGATSLLGSNMQPSYTWLVYLHKKGNWQDLPKAGPSTTTHGPGVVGSGVVLVLASVRVVVVGVEVVVEVEVLVEVVEVVTSFLLEHTALQSNPELVFFLSVFHNILAEDWKIRGFFTDGLLDPQNLSR